jgi:hypothetical protein
MSPLMFQQLMKGGLFGSASSVFGTGVGAKYFGSMGGLGGQSNFEAAKGWLTKQYPGNSTGSKALRAQAMAGLFGIPVAQAESLLLMSPVDTGATQALIGRAGLDTNKLSPTSFLGLASVAGAKDMAGLAGVASNVMSRSDISDDEKKQISAAIQGGNFGDAQNVLAKIVGSHDQEKTQGEQLRTTLADLRNVMTEVGAELLSPIITIRDVIVKMAGVAKGGSGGVIDTTDGTPSGQANADYGIFPDLSGNATLMMVPNLAKAAANKLKMITPASDFDPIFSAAGQRYRIDPKLLKAISVQESSLNPRATNGKSSAKGLMQLIDGTASSMGVKNPFDAYDNVMGGAKYYAQMLKLANGDEAKALATYHGSVPGGNSDADRAYASSIEGLYHPIPDGGKAGGGNQAVDVNVKLGGEVRLPVTDQNGTDIGGAYLRLYPGSYGALGAGLGAP